MDLSVQTLQGPPPLQAPQPLAFLPPGAIPLPDSGVGAYSQGIRNGAEIAAPLQQGIEQVGYWNSPAGKAAIAHSQLQKTQALQENDAALQTPTIPLQQRVLQGTEINSALQQLPSQTKLGIAGNESKLATLPSLTEQTITGAEAATQKARNEIATTPTYNETNGMSQEEIGLNAQRQANAIDEAKKHSQVSLALLPPGILGENGTGGLGVQYYPTFTGGKMSLKPETTQMIQQQDEDGTYHNVLVGKETGRIYKDFGKGIQQARLDQSNNRTLIASGVAPEDATEEQRQAAKNRNQQVFGEENLGVGGQRRANQVGTQFQSTFNKIYAPKFQLLQGFESVAQKAVDPNTASGVPDVDLIDAAGKLYKGGAMTEVQFKAIKNATGLDDRIWNAPEMLGKGKVLTPAQRTDLIDSVRLFANELESSYQRDYDSAAGKLPQGANPEHYLGPRAYAADSGSEVLQNNPNTYVTPQAHQQAIDWANANPQDPRAAVILQTAQQALGNGR